MIELHNATVSAPTADGPVTILRPTTLSLREHRISIIGANGSGKSTLARLLNGLIVPSSGHVRVRTDGHGTTGRGTTGHSTAGTDTVADTTTSSNSAANNRPQAGTADEDAVVGTRGRGSTAQEPWLDTRKHGAAVRRSVGFVFTDPGAQLVMPTAIEDVTLSLRKQYRDKRERHAAALTALARFGLEPLAERSVHTLSGGQRQLLAIASVLAVQPSILVADEPTTLLDLRNSRVVSELLLSLPQQVITVTHDLELAARFDRTLVVADAEVVFDGDPHEAVEWYRSRA